MGVVTYPGRTGINQKAPEVASTVGTNVPVATDRDGICQAQTTAGAASLTMNGAGVASGSYVVGFDGGRKVTVYSTGNLSAKTFAITGTDKDGAAQSENITGPNNGTATGTKYYQTVTAVSVDAAVGTNVEIGFSASLYVLDVRKATHFKFSPTAGETVLIAIYGGAGTGYKTVCTLNFTVPGSGTFTWADGSTPTDTRVYFAGGTEPTLTTSGTDYFTFQNDATQVSSDDVWYCTDVVQDLKP
jgi:hypothetical protein